LITIGVAGGSGSGKTTFAKSLTARLGHERVLVLAQDSYYIDRSKEFDHDGGRVNFDHPDSIDWSLLEEHLRDLAAGRAIEVPIYDFATHQRQKTTLHVKARPYLVLDGILIFVHEKIRNRLQHKIFIEAAENIRFERRLNRDVVERGRTPEGVRAQFFNQVKPMHDQFVEPSRQYADIVISGEKNFAPAVESLARKLESLI
jgi:uridine kinase